MRSPILWFSQIIKILSNSLYFRSKARIEFGDVDPIEGDINAEPASLYVHRSAKKVFINKAVDGWEEVGAGGSAGGELLDTKVITSSGTYTKNTSASYIIIEAAGAGGGGGGAAATGSSNALGACGGGGEYVLKIIQNGDVENTETVTIGAGGDGGTGNNPGTKGGDTSFGSHLEAVGGNGGEGMASSTFDGVAQGGTGGTGGNGGGFRVAGSNGSSTTTLSSNAQGNKGEGFGGKNPLSSNTRQPTLNNDGLNGSAFGGGASGARNGNSQTEKTGGTGGNGGIIIREYS
jgi:hypothetical protein